jgi:[ribosomal protein S5]-alanine N-acetyltransferase
MVNLADVVIETERLKLIPVSERYAKDIFKEFNSVVTVYMMPKPAEKIEETLEFIHSSQEKIKNGVDLVVVILDKQTGEFLGCAGLHRVNTETPELGIWTKVSAHGKGIGREAITGLYYWARENLTYKYIVYPVDKRNTSSRKIPESLGGVIEDEYQKTNMSGNVLDEVEYRIYPQKQTSMMD